VHASGVVDGIHFVDVGPRGADAVVLIHGLTATHRFWQQNIDALATRRRVLAPDLPGFGRSHKPDVDYSIDFFVAALWALLDAAGVARATLVGNSMGGHIAMAAALAAPARVDKLILVDPAGVHPLPSWLLRAAALGVGAATAASGQLPVPRMPRALLELLFRAVFPTRRDLARRYVDAYARAVASDEYHLHLRSTLRAVRGVMRRPMQRRLAALRTPTLIMWGARDYLLPVTAARQLHRLIPGARLIIYSRSGHCPMVDQPDRWNRDVLAFLDGFPVGRGV
jgi:pimeloyl-ACP methyl ester carboxylesterase